MRDERAKQTKRSKPLLMCVIAGLAFIAEALLSTGGVPPKHGVALAGVSSPAAAGLASAPRDVVSPRDANADRDTLELQLD